jgi:hypothetical protein
MLGLAFFVEQIICSTRHTENPVSLQDGTELKEMSIRVAGRTVLFRERGWWGAATLHRDK